MVAQKIYSVYFTVFTQFAFSVAADPRKHGGGIMSLLCRFSVQKIGLRLIVFDLSLTRYAWSQSHCVMVSFTSLARKSDEADLVLVLPTKTTLMNWMQQPGYPLLLPPVDQVIAHLQQVSPKK